LGKGVQALFNMQKLIGVRERASKGLLNASIQGKKDRCTNATMAEKKESIPQTKKAQHI
jgi:hypothetical protein